jgi:hypothetical protein
MQAAISTYTLDQLFGQPPDTPVRAALRSPIFSRDEYRLGGADSVLLDAFPSAADVSCCFLRLSMGEARSVRLAASGTYRLVSREHVGWLLIPTDAAKPSYWIPQPPLLRRSDPLGHILAERPVSLTGLNATPDEITVDLKLPREWCLDWVIWRFGPKAAHVSAALQQRLSIEEKAYFLWGSKVNFNLPAGAYQYLVHGQVYTNDFVWPRNWKFCSELDAYGLYLALDGLQSASGKALYGLLKTQILYSVVARQAEDGGWYQGEWTDLMESHYRLHNSAMLMLAAGLEEFGDDALRTSLAKAAAFLASCTDHTGIGAWFLHDSLENSVEAMEEMRRQTNTPWIPSGTLGKSATNKLILNTHLDAIVAMERYRDATGDLQYADLIASARKAARSLLALRPAEWLYRLIYEAIRLTLLPRQKAMDLPLPLRMLKRLTWMYVTPRMHRIKRIFPRIVMPGGLIERHIAPMHFDINYHPVNVMDLARYWRRFPDENLATIVDDAVKAVMETGLLEYWSEAEQRQFSVVEWADALYQLCTLSPEISLRRQLGQTLLLVHDNQLGLPPALLGADTEITRRSQRPPCPSPADERLIVANLGHGANFEILVVNPERVGVELAWESPPGKNLIWTSADGTAVSAPALSMRVPPRGCLIGRAQDTLKV